MSTARKQKRLTVAEKCKILKKLDAGVLANRLAMDFHVSEASISKIKRNKAKIYAAVSGTCDEIKRKTLHKAEYVDLEKQLYKWFLDQRERNCPISGPILKAKAKTLFEQIYPDRTPNDFRASQGWFSKFKRRYGIRILKVCGEILSSDTSTITPFIYALRAKMHEMEILNEQLYNADESGLFFRCLPDKGYVAACEKTAPGRKIRKERVTFMLCANAEGSHKLKPLVIGKAAKPRCFLNFKNPLDYDYSANAWMTANIFKTWFHTKFVKEVRNDFIH